MTLRLGTFNVWGLPEIFGLGDDVTARTREIARRLARSDLDVLMIQEAWTDPVQRTLRAGAALAGFHVATAGGGGLMTLSRPPVLTTDFQRFRFRGDPERIDQGEFLGGKGFQTVTVEHAGRSLPIVNTHLHARYRKARPRLNAAVRVAQLMQLLRHLADTPGTVVVGGDFNCAVGDLEYEIFRGLSGSIELGGGSRHPTLSRTNYYKRHRTAEDKRIDFLFVRPAAESRWRGEDARLLFAETAEIRQIERSLSDHFGFRATLVADGPPAGRASREPAAAPPDPRALALARDLLSEGDADARRRRSGQLASALGFAGLAAVACGARRTSPVDRRAFLRRGLGLTAWAAMLPAGGLTALAQFDGDAKRSAFAEARAALALFAHRAGEAPSRREDASAAGRDPQHSTTTDEVSA